MNKKFILLDSRDNVVTVTKTLKEGEEIVIGDEKIVIAEGEIPQWHKVAIDEIKFGEKVRKYGTTIGVATKTIKAGSHVHSHNLRTQQDQTVLENTDKELQE